MDRSQIEIKIKELQEDLRQLESQYLIVFGLGKRAKLLDEIQRKTVEMLSFKRQLKELIKT